MKIKYLTISASPTGIRHVGDVDDLPDIIASALVRGGYAEVIPSPPSQPVLETTEKESTGETTEAIPQRKRGR